MVFPLLASSAFAFNGRANLSYSRGESFEEGERISTSDRTTQNYFLGLSRPLTPVISYRLSVNASIFDQSTESEGLIKKTYRRSGSAGVDLTLDNPFFHLTSGYIRRERWTTARLRDDSRRTTEFYYARLNIVTRDFPTLYLEFDRSNTYDHFPIMKTDTTTTKYSASSAYSYRGEDLTAHYTLNYTRTQTETPLALTRKTLIDAYSGSYGIKYNKDFWDKAIDMNAEYRGSIGMTDTTRTVGETGLVLFRRIPRVGLHASDLAPNDILLLSEEPDLTNLDYETPINDINIGTDLLFHNIGIELDTLEEGKVVDRIFVYVFVPAGTSLNDPPVVTDWRAYKSETNPPELPETEWTEVLIQEVILHPPSEVTDINPDVDNPDVYLYEIVFTAPQQDVRFYKVVNQVAVSQTGLEDVFVTEIEAQGEELVTAGETTTSNDFFSQGINLRMSLRPLKKVRVILNYNINRTDANPDSFLDPVTGIFKSIFVKDLEQGVEGDDLRISVRRNFGASVIWETLRLLTTTLRAQRSEFFDNEGLTDSSANSYLISFDSSPLPTLDAHLSAIRSESFSFGDKQSTSHSLLLTLGTKLYKEVRMTTDTGYTNGENHKTGATTTTEFIRGTIDARVTSTLFAHMTYGIEWVSSEDTSSSAKDGSVIISYRPARLISFSGNFRIRDSEDERTTTEGISVSWLPLTVIRIIGSYQHRNVSPGPETTDSVSASVKWQISKSVDARFSVGYTRSLREIMTESRSFRVSLNGRF